MARFYRLLKHLSSLLLVAGALGFVVSSQLKGELPNPQQIVQSLYSDPIQERVSEQSFALNYRDAKYTVEPVADYQIWGLVVTHNDIEAFDDIYHDENSVDIKDLCVIWGDNLAEDTYREGIEFWSEPWTCYYRAKTREVGDAFYKDQLSNTHLLSAYEAVRDKIRDVRVGDQIYMEGRLVNYYPEGRESWRRNSSTIRTDTGNGACEVMLVDNVEILKPGTPQWYALYDGSKWAIGVALLLKLAMFLFMPYRHYVK